MSAGRFILLVHLDGIDNADLFKGLVPFQNAFADPPAIAHGRRMFDVEDDGLLWGTHLEVMGRPSADAIG